MVSLPAMIVLELHDEVVISPLPEVGAWPSMEHLMLRGLPTLPSALARHRQMLLATLPSKLLTLNLPQVGSRDFATIARYTALTALEIGTICRVPSSDFGLRRYESEGVSMLSTLRDMCDLSLAVRCGSRPVLAAISGMPHLTSLNLSNSVGLNHTDAAALCDAVFALPAFRVLDLSDIDTLHGDAATWERDELPRLRASIAALSVLPAAPYHPSTK
jgi:hypothetical protein